MIDLESSNVTLRHCLKGNLILCYYCKSIFNLWFIFFSVFPALSFPVDEVNFDMGPTTSAEFGPNNLSNSMSMEKLKFAIQDSMSKSGIEKNNLNLNAIQKFVQEFKKSSMSPNDVPKVCNFC